MSLTFMDSTIISIVNYFLLPIQFPVLSLMEIILVSLPSLVP